MFCKYCGSKMKSNYCTQCGKHRTMDADRLAKALGVSEEVMDATLKSLKLVVKEEQKHD